MAWADSFAAGLLVDNAIVVIENINRHIEEKLVDKEHFDPHDMETRRIIAQAAELGTREMGNAVIACTLTTVAVFLPVVYVPGVAGAFFRDQALTVTIALTVSIAAALLLQPMLAARFFKPEKKVKRGLFRLTDDAYQAFFRVYHGVLEKALRRPKSMMVGLLALFVVCGLLATRIPRSLMPERSSGDLRLELEFPTGTPLEETSQAVADLADWMEAQDHVEKVFTQVGTTERTLAAMKDYTAPNTARMRIIMDTGRDAYESSLRLQHEVAEKLVDATGVRYAFREEGAGLTEVLATDEAPFSGGFWPSVRRTPSPPPPRSWPRSGVRNA